MKKITNQIIYNLRKEKSPFISFGVIVLITALILNCGAVLLHQVDRAYEEKFDKLNTAALNAIVPKFQNSTELEKAIDEIETVEKTERHTAVMTEAIVKDFNGADFSMNTVFYNIDHKRTLNNFELVSESEYDVDNPIYIPLYVSEFGGFALNDEIVYVIDGKSHSFIVAGVIEEMQYGNYGSGFLCAYLPGEEFEEFADSYNDKAVVEYSMLVKSDACIDKVKDNVSQIIENKGAMTVSILDSQSVKETRTMVTNLLVLILAAFALIILAVSVFLGNFKVKNAIESEITNMSVLKALGYTSPQIVASITLPYGMVSLLFAILGVGLSYGLLPVLCKVLTVQSGFSFAVGFDLFGFVCVTCILCGVVTFFTFITARKIRKLQPIDGLRGNTSFKHKKKNPFPLEDTKGNTKILLIVKQMAVSKKQNVMLFFVSFILMVLISFSGTLFYNVIVKPDNFMAALSDETADVIVYPNCDCVSELELRLNKDNRVQNSLKYMYASVKIENKTVTAFACEDFSKVRNDVCYMGQNPKEADEIALGSAFEETVQIGDIVSVTVGDCTKNFVVTGFVQSINLQGELCELTIEGYNSFFTKDQTPSIYVYLKDSKDAELITKEYKAEFPELVADTVNAHKLQMEAQNMYMGITMVLVAAIFVVTILIVLFILYIVIKSLLVKRKQELGIYKAMGYTSSQLILQTAGSVMPVSIIAIVLSSVLAIFYVPAIYGFIFAAMGVMKNSIEISFGFLLLFSAAQIFVNIMISVILCMPIRKISAYELMKE